ncbi:hypothetical protein SAMN02910447_01673 [Ruminococcus sp. YE71]|uniref:hypothetical protein n=1 Tax=unclassified Ruminococcus TaxID=2608920 RepID=UPI000887212B|nr:MULTISPECIES: hypothetical protein [unclassified Ruminococcus]SDA20055.1 hypothetical protein SAMN02910446_01674 [Ruminococcus sp. YE78]SFW31766.1 hypothetical protein SAMN02910447_01673 [Ruminococcus sp. YE71]
MKRSKKNVAFITAMTLTITSIAALQASAANGYNSAANVGSRFSMFEEDTSVYGSTYPCFRFNNISEMRAGEEGYFNIRFDSSYETPIASINLQLLYDPSVFEIYKFEAPYNSVFSNVKGGWGEGWENNYSACQCGVFPIEWKYSESGNYNGDGVIGKVYFKIKDNAAIGKPVYYEFKLQGDCNNADGKPVTDPKTERTVTFLNSNIKVVPSSNRQINKTLPKISADARGESYVDISWDPVADAQSYRICEFEENGWVEKIVSYSYKEKDHKYICRLYNLEYNMDHKIAVIPRFNNEWYEGNFANAITVSPKDFLDKLRPDIDVKSKDDKIMVKWTKVNGATAYAVAYTTPNELGEYDGQKWKVAKTYSKETTSVTYSNIPNGKYKMAVVAKVNGVWYKDYPDAEGKTKEVTVNDERWKNKPKYDLVTLYDNLLDDSELFSTDSISNEDESNRLKDLNGDLVRIPVDGGDKFKNAYTFNRYHDGFPDGEFVITPNRDSDYVIDVTKVNKEDDVILHVKYMPDGSIINPNPTSAYMEPSKVEFDADNHIAHYTFSLKEGVEYKIEVSNYLGIYNYEDFQITISQDNWVYAPYGGKQEFYMCKKMFIPSDTLLEAVKLSSKNAVIINNEASIEDQTAAIMKSLELDNNSKTVVDAVLTVVSAATGSALETVIEAAIVDPEPATKTILVAVAVDGATVYFLISSAKGVSDFFDALDFKNACYDGNLNIVLTKQRNGNCLNNYWDPWITSNYNYINKYSDDIDILNDRAHVIVTPNKSAQDVVEFWELD